jgi:hypothetical protein
MQAGNTGFRHEFLTELTIAKTQSHALADSVPEELYGWSPAQDARTFSAVLVHVAVGNFMLLYRVGVRSLAVTNLYSSLEGDLAKRIVAMVHKNVAMEKTVTAKREVIDLLRRSFDTLAEAIAAATDEELEVTEDFFGKPETVRRVYLRMLTHCHEHMGQAIAYVRCMGFKAPWLDPLKDLDRIAASAEAHKLTA